LLYRKHTFRINKIISLLTLSDIFAWGGFTVVSVLMGIYISEKIGADAARIVGIGMAIYLLFRSITQLPLGFLLDKIQKDHDDILVLFFGCILMGLAFVLYPLIENELTYYLIQVLLGVGASMNLISWRKLFAENLNKGSRGLSYGIYGTLMGIATALLSLLGGFVANMGSQYFDLVIIVLGIWVMLGGAWGGAVVFIKKRKSDC
jgi:MFS family permease